MTRGSVAAVLLAVLLTVSGSIWVLDLHGHKFSDNLKGATIWRLDPGGV